jgi:hypothetical protein
VDWNDTLFLRDLWIIAWIDEINLSSVDCKSSSSSSFDLSIDQKFYVELKKVYFMGSEMQPGVMRAQEREIQLRKISSSSFYMELEVFFTIIQQTFFYFFFTKAQSFQRLPHSEG